LGKAKPPIGHHLILGGGLLLWNDNKNHQKPYNNKIQAGFLLAVKPNSKIGL
jgi:hypothetical protein